MLILIGFAVTWLIVSLIFAYIINFYRIKYSFNASANDGISMFLIGFAWGPIGLILGFAPPIKTAMIFGGLSGSIVAYTVFQNL